MSDQTDHITMIAMAKILLQHSPIPHNLRVLGSSRLAHTAHAYTLRHTARDV